jgi:hypothetical protein
MQRIVADYVSAGEEWPAAMREEHIIDPQGRTVRAKHAARFDVGGQPLVLWADIRSADRTVRRFFTGH